MSQIAWAHQSFHRARNRGRSAANKLGGSYGSNGARARTRRNGANGGAVADLYHAYFTGLILTMVTRRGKADGCRVRVSRVSPPAAGAISDRPRQAWPLSVLPPAVAAAQYHYLSNWIGGVHVEYIYESDRKAWIRYPPPRWIWRGTAICGIPGEVSRAMLRGWHGNNGVALGDLRLGFVCTKQRRGRAGWARRLFLLHENAHVGDRPAR